MRSLTQIYETGSNGSSVRVYSPNNKPTPGELGAAVNSEVVHLAGTETISGSKTFTTAPTVSSLTVGSNGNITESLNGLSIQSGNPKAGVIVDGDLLALYSTDGMSLGREEAGSTWTNLYLSGKINNLILPSGSETLATVSNVTTETNRATSAESTLDSKITIIQGLIPAQASTSNQLADRDFVNSSISNSAAQFVVPSTSSSNTQWSSLAALQAGPWYWNGVSYTPTKNDYAIYLNSDNSVWRAHYTGTTWVAQYKVNDSPFTAAQQAALDSGITASLVSTIPNKVNNTTTVNGHALSSNVVVTKDDVGLGSVPNVNCQVASNITSGTLALSRLPSNLIVNPSGDTSVNITRNASGQWELSVAESPPPDVPTLAAIGFSSSDWLTSTAAIDTQLGTKYYDIHLHSSQKVYSLRVISAVNLTTSMGVEDSPEVICANRQHSGNMYLRIYSNLAFDGEARYIQY